ncbi:MAG: hypothetical protein LQ347_001250 [Umbilicaria vellea]|nr:MAG: hypothetical protein LQ347_001250 [Umbilicaria vellea]
MDALCTSLQTTVISGTNPPARSPSSNPKLGFLDFPAEIRNQIYGYLFIDPDRRGRTSTRRRRAHLQGQFLRCARQIHHEAYLMLYASNRFSIEVHPDDIIFPCSPRLNKADRMAISRDWAITIHLFPPGQTLTRSEQLDLLATNQRKIHRNLRNIVFTLAAQPGPQHAIMITIPQNLALDRSLTHPHTGILSAFHSLRANDIRINYLLPTHNTAPRHPTAIRLRRYVQSIERAMRRYDDPNPSIAHLYAEAETYTAAFFAAPSAWVAGIGFAPDGLHDLPQVMDLSELIEQRGPEKEPCSEFLWEETFRTNYMAEFRYRIMAALEVLENRWRVVEDAREIMSWKGKPDVKAIERIVEYINTHPDTISTSQARTDRLDRAFGLLGYVRAFQEPFANQSARGKENFHQEMEKRREMSYEERAEEFLPSLQMEQIRKSYEDLLEGVIEVEEMVDAAATVKEWCETQWAEMKTSREDFYQRPLWRRWMAGWAPNLDWKDDIC